MNKNVAKKPKLSPQAGMQLILKTAAEITVLWFAGAGADNYSSYADYDKKLKALLTMLRDTINEALGE